MMQYTSGVQMFRLDFAVLAEKPPTMEDLKAMIAREYLKVYNFNQSHAAKALGLNRKTFRSLCAKHNINMRSTV